MENHASSEIQDELETQAADFLEDQDIAHPRTFAVGAAEVDLSGRKSAEGELESEDIGKKVTSTPEKKNADLRNLFASRNSVEPCDDVSVVLTTSEAPLPDALRAAENPLPSSVRSGGVLAAFGLSLSPWQDDLPQDALAATPSADDPAERGAFLEQQVISTPVALSGLGAVVPLLVARAPLLPSGQAIFAQLPDSWVELSCRTDALGIRCLFASRRHEHSIFEALSPCRFLRVPDTARNWQVQLQVPDDAPAYVQLADENAWIVQGHPVRRQVRVLVRPGVLLTKMLRRGRDSLPSARFTWRVVESADSGRFGSSHPSRRGLLHQSLGEFAILSNLEDAACSQPPHFVEWPLRREQLRSLGWMVSQERRRKDPFVTELRDAVPFPDAPHWKLEGSLRCEYGAVRGGVLADAIGYGKTACTIGLVSFSACQPPPQVPAAFAGLLPSRATLVLAPTNLQAQWVAEIKKFTGSALKVISVPTYSQLKRLTAKEIMEADVVVATYRLFYSTPYLKRLEEVARERNPSFSFPKQSCVEGSRRVSGCRVAGDWAKAYRRAFEMLPAWVTAARNTSDAPVTPERLAASTVAERGDDVTPEEVTRRCQAGKPKRSRANQGTEKSAATRVSSVPGDSDQNQTQTQQSQPKRRKIGKQKAEAGGTPPASPAVGRSDDDATSAPRSLLLADWSVTARYVPLEAFWWRRVVCDEFHELLSRYPPAQAAVELFQADYKWGLSGTPPCQTLAQIRKAAGFFGVQIPQTIGESVDEDLAEVPRQVAQEWLDAFVRRNTAELPPLEEEERIMAVRLTPSERALYDALARQHERNVSASQTVGGDSLCDAGTIVSQSTDSVARPLGVKGLLKLCSHFSAAGAASAATAADELHRQVSLRHGKVRSAEREAAIIAQKAAEISRAVRHFDPHFCRSTDDGQVDFPCIARESKPTIANRLRFLGAQVIGTKPEMLARFFSKLSDASISEAAREMAVRADFDFADAGRASDLACAPAVAPTWMALAVAQVPSAGSGVVSKAIGDALKQAACVSKLSDGFAIPPRCVRLRAQLGMPKWKGSSEEERSTFEQEDWAWRQDRGNADKLRNIVLSWKEDVERCAVKLSSLEKDAEAKHDEYIDFVDTVQASQAAAEADAEVVPVPAATFAKYGSKIEMLVGHIQRLTSQDPSCKIICFVQWEDLKRKISAAFEEFELEHLTLHGSVWSRRAALMKFQYEEVGSRLLLLSLQESASGTNLTAANHVIIVHPMEAATREEAIAFEMQAVGRVRRPGQQRKIYVWRFVTMGTIEQEITEEHQRSLWERQQERIETSLADDALQSNLGNENAESDGEDEPHVAEALADDIATQAYLRDPPSSQEPRTMVSQEDSATQAYVCDERTVVGESERSESMSGSVATPSFAACSKDGQDRLLMPPPAFPPAKRFKASINSMDAVADSPSAAVDAPSDQLCDDSTQPYMDGCSHGSTFHLVESEANPNSKPTLFYDASYATAAMTDCLPESRREDSNADSDATQHY
eukprot:TRINITY_DN2055_c0_g1_i4.p1 TRINITY_DN2055_c0_g1~~TRINITY_DN2055_c0_g1_i4.p1  ORF type:complete len:1512 (-),score=285.73 TRINITY_DN2055_c0_g1_i4:594-5129(-)